MSNQGTAGATSPRLSGQQYRELFEESHDAILIIARDGVILDANHAASELFAWPHFLGVLVGDTPSMGTAHDPVTYSPFGVVEPA